MEKGFAETDNCEVRPCEEAAGGEVSVSVFTVGCYTVRMAYCLYVDDSDREVKYAEWIPAISGLCPIGKNVRMVMEVSARYNPSSEPSVDHWQNICIATGFHTWTEGIGYICAVKSSEMAPDSQAALFVLVRPAGSPPDAWQWYRFMPDSKAEECNMGGSRRGDAAAREP